MIQRRPSKKEDSVEEDWLLTFSDMVTLILTFFILLASISKVDLVKFEQVQSGITKEIGNRDVVKPIEAARTELELKISEMQIADTVSLGQDHQGLVLEFDAGAFFAQGSAELTAQGRSAMANLATTLTSPSYSHFQVEVEGHTDDNQVATTQFPSNWELSAARAASTVRLFIATGIDPTRLRAVGLADVAPKVPNRTADGNPLPDNQAVNRRVAVRVHPR